MGCLEWGQGNPLQDAWNGGRVTHYEMFGMGEGNLLWDTWNRGRVTHYGML